MDTQKIVNCSDQDEGGSPNKINGNSDSFVIIDIETLSSSYTPTQTGTERDASSSTNTTTNSRNNFQRSVSRKVSSQQRGKPTHQKDSTHGGGGGGDGDGVGDEFSPKGGTLMGENTLKNIHQLPLVMVVGGNGMGPINENINNNNNNKKKGQPTVTINGAQSNPTSRWKRSYSTRQRSSSSTTNWFMDPRRILFIFATLSSMGTIILIYFTLSIGKVNNNGGASMDYS